MTGGSVVLVSPMGERNKIRAVDAEYVIGGRLWLDRRREVAFIFARHKATSHGKL